MDRSVDVFGGSFAIAVRVHGTPADEPLPPGAARIIAFPGAGDNSGSFDSLAPLLTAEAPRHCLVAVDPPGCGHSDHRPAYDYYNDFEDCALTIEIADALGWPAHEPLVVLGHSRGGNIAATAAGAFADRINGALLLETNLGLNGVFITNIGQPQPPTVAAMVKSDARRRKRQRSSASRELSELVEKSMDFVRADGGHYSKSRETATAILRRGTEPHPDGGGVRHRGDPRASGVQCMMMDDGFTAGVLPGDPLPVAPRHLRHLCPALRPPQTEPSLSAVHGQSGGASGGVRHVAGGGVAAGRVWASSPLGSAAANSGSAVALPRQAGRAAFPAGACASSGAGSGWRQRSTSGAGSGGG